MRKRLFVDAPLTHLPPSPHCAVVTGAADEIGSACARSLRAAGFDLVLADIDQVPLSRLARELGAHALPCDVLSEMSVQELVAEAQKVLPVIDLLINAAGSGHVRTLGMMRVSRAFTAAAGGHPLTVMNLSAVTRGKAQPFGYAGTPTAFRRLSHGLGEVLRAQGVDVLTLDAASTAEDAAAQVLQCWNGRTARGENGQARRAHG